MQSKTHYKNNRKSLEQTETHSVFPKIGAPAERALSRADIHTLKNLTRYTESEISNLHGVGPKVIKILRGALKKSLGLKSNSQMWFDILCMFGKFSV